MFQRLLPVRLGPSKAPARPQVSKEVSVWFCALGVLGLPMSAPSAGLSGSLRCLRDLEPQKLGRF